MPKIRSVKDVARWHLCVGCGACAYGCPDNKIRLVDFLNEGIRPVQLEEGCASCSTCLDYCPAYSLDYSAHEDRLGIIKELYPLFGPVLEVWEGHAIDPEIRYRGSSGGALTALSTFCLERLNMHGVLHIGADENDPVRNITVLSTNRQALLEKAGSRYAPGSVCDRLSLVETAPGLCVIIGQPCEAAAIEKARHVAPALNQKIGLVLSFFCAGSPATQGTVDLLGTAGISRNKVHALRYRGFGWPGHFVAWLANNKAPAMNMTYRESWHFLQKYRPYSIHLWPDDTGEAADIACGDPWYESPKEGDPGSSLIVVRSENGRRILHQAMRAGYLELKKAENWKLLKSQVNLSRKRQAIAGRRLAFKLFGLPLGELRGFRLFSIWLKLGVKEQFKSLFGTIRRIIYRKYYRPNEYR